MESLFSLEVIINYVKLNSRSTVCLFPCVAFRLLDYPTIAINLLDEYDSKQIKSQFQLTQPFDQIENLPCFNELLDKYGRFIFSRGKSCLFRSDMETLKNHLKTAPMYLLLLDTFVQPYKLIGSALIPMFNLINDIYNETELNGSKNAENPCTKMTHGIFEIKNLLGEELGHISFACRLTCYGTSLLPHIETTATEAFQRQFKQINKKASIPKEDLLNEEHEAYVYKLNKSIDTKTTNKIKTQNALIQTLQIDYQDAQVQINQNVEKKEPIQQTEISRPIVSEQIKEKVKKTENIYTIKHIPDENAFNHYTPPALHYNSINDKQAKLKIDSSSQHVTEIINKSNFINSRVQYLNEALNHSDEETLEQNQEEAQIIIEPRQNLVSNKPVLNQLNLDQMPLLKQLLDEMNLMQNMLKNQPTKDFIANQKVEHKTKNLVGILRQPNEIKTKKTTVKKTMASKQALIESVNRLVTPRNTKKNEKIIPLTNSYDEIPVGPRKSPKEETLNIKKPPLKYGITNTHRMRVLANNPNKINEIDQKHKKLITEIKANIDEITASLNTTHQTFNESNNLEKVLFESTVVSNMSSNTSVLMSSLPKTNKMNFSLLNKVDLDSTNDNTMYPALLGSKTNESTRQDLHATKVVQFGNTYVLNTSFNENLNSEESSKRSKSEPKSESQTESSETSESSSKEDKSNSNYNRNIFLENKSYDDDDFNSSLNSSLPSKPSKSTESNFFTADHKDRKKRGLLRQSSIHESNHEDDDDDEIKESFSEMEYLKSANYSDLNRSASRYSSSEYNMKSFIDDSFSISKDSNKS